jgi:hypothetical protein
MKRKQKKNKLNLSFRQMSYSNNFQLNKIIKKKIHLNSNLNTSDLQKENKKLISDYERKNKQFEIVEKKKKNKNI